MIFKLARGRKFSGEQYKDNKVLHLGAIGLIAASRKLMFNKFPRGNYQPIVPRQKHYSSS